MCVGDGPAGLQVVGHQHGIHMRRCIPQACGPRAGDGAVLIVLRPDLHAAWADQLHPAPVIAFAPYAISPAISAWRVCAVLT
jgi:hypothetical protein